MTPTDWGQYLGAQGGLLIMLALVLIIFPGILVSVGEVKNRGLKFLLFTLMGFGFILALISFVLWSLSIWAYANA